MAGNARKTSTTVPRVPYLSVAGIAFVSHHSVMAYAECLACHYEEVTARMVPSVAVSASTLPFKGRAPASTLSTSQSSRSLAIPEWHLDAACSISGAGSTPAMSVLPSLREMDWLMSYAPPKCETTSFEPDDDMTVVSTADDDFNLPLGSSPVAADPCSPHTVSGLAAALAQVATAVEASQATATERWCADKGGRADLHYYLVRYTRKDEEKREADGSLLSETLAVKLADRATCPYTDVFICSHGFNTDIHDVEDSYQIRMGAMADDKADRAAADAARRAAVGKPFCALMIGIQWSSKLWTAKFAGRLAGKSSPAPRSMGKMSAAAAGATTDAAVERQHGELVENINEDAAAVAARAAVKNALHTIADASMHPPDEVATAATAIDAGTGVEGAKRSLPPSLKAAFQAMATDLAAVDAELTDGEDGDEPVEPVDPDVAFGAAVDELTAEAAAAAKAAASPPPADVAAGATAGPTGTTVASRGFFTFLASAAATAATALLLRRTAIITLFGRYQRRAKVVGRTGVRQLLATLIVATGGQATRGIIKFHAAGHSLGAHVVSSAIVGLRGDRRTSPARVHSLALVQGAVPADAYGAGGAYGALTAANSRVAGAIVATHSSSDRALWFYGRANGGELLGRVGATHTRPSTPRRVSMTAVHQAYGLTPNGTFVNVDAGAFIDKVEGGLGGKAVGSHSDMTDAATTHLVWEAALVGGVRDYGGAAEGATR